MSLYTLPTDHRPHRRDVLRAGSLGLLGLSLGDLLAGQAVRARASEIAQPPSFGRAKACILLFMWGGPAQQDTWDLKPHAPAEIRGEFTPISSRVPGIHVCEHFPHLAGRTDRLAIVRSVTHSDVNHTTATHFLLTGQPPPQSPDLRADWPHIGAVLSQLGRGKPPLPPFVSLRPKLPNDVPRFVEQSHGQSAGWLGQSLDPLSIDANPAAQDYRVGAFELPAEISVSRLDDRRNLLRNVNQQLSRNSENAALEAMDQHVHRAFDILHSATAGGAFDLSQEPEAVRERYGLNPHGQSVLQARRLVERGVPLVTVFWPSDGIKNVSVYWDTHSRNFIDLKDRLMPPADQAFSTLLDDLQQRGLLDETLVVWTGEFGRTPRVGQRNSDAGAGRDGRDHWPGCFTSVLAGGGVRGGQVYGSSDRHAAYPASNPVAPVDLVATVYHLLGVPEHLALPDAQGRPLVVCPGTPIRELIA
ncbi:MAG: DUF1501 domain-containing protein [Planctomycetota bacterium]|nr:MAG: DUF1501 domain-containing protein [Planctomycetota bacterium]